MEDARPIVMSDHNRDHPEIRPARGSPPFRVQLRHSPGGGRQRGDCTEKKTKRRKAHPVRPVSPKNNTRAKSSNKGAITKQKTEQHPPGSSA